METKVILKVENLVKIFKGDLLTKPQKVLNEISFEVQAKKTTGFIGINGAGKTTTLKCVLGFIFPDSGNVTYFDDQKLTDQVKARIGFLPERPYFYDYLTGREFLDFHWRLVPQSPIKDFASRMEEVLKLVDLFEARNKRLRNYSKGMLQRIGFAQAMFHKPDLLILDEPMSGLDPDGRNMMKEIFKHLASQGTTVFFSSHLLQDMEELCQNIIILDRGKTRYQGTVSSFLSRYPENNLEVAFQKLRKEGVS